MAQVIDFPHGLPFHTDQKKSAFVKQLKKILKNIGVPYADTCCADVDTTNVPVSFNSTTGVISANGTAVGSSSKGAVTQSGTKTTAVVLDKTSGVITTVALTDAADTSFQFTFTNANIVAGSVITLSPLNSGNGIVNLSVVSIATGSAVLRVANTGTAAFNSAIKIHFTIS